MIGFQPFQGEVDGERCLIIGYIPEVDNMLCVSAKGEILTVKRPSVTVDWHFDQTLNAWRMNDAQDAEEVLHELGAKINTAARALWEIADFDHTTNCINRENFSVWECTCQKLMPNQMARLALEVLHFDEEEDEDEEVPVPPLHDENPS